MTSLLSVLHALGLACLIGITVWPAWPSDMLTPFRPLILALAAVPLCIALLRRDRRLVGMSVLILLAAALPMAVRLVGRPVLPASASAGRSVSLVFSNVLCDNRQFHRVVAMAEAEDADIFAAAETTPEWFRHLDTLSDRYPYHFTPPVFGIFGIALYAKRPFSAQAFAIGRQGMALVRADFGDTIVYVAHPKPTASVALTANNRAYLVDLAQRVAVERKPVIVTGDLNATLWSHGLSPLMAEHLQWPQGSGMAYSWPVAHPLMAIQIDQVLTRGRVPTIIGC